MGEPRHWETPLQVIVDLLITNGKPDRGYAHVQNQLPVIPCNPDLQFMHKAEIPRSVSRLTWRGGGGGGASDRGIEKHLL